MKNLFLLFLKDQMPLMSDLDLYTMYKNYRDKAFVSLMDGDLKKYSKYREYAEVLREEVVRRC